MPEEDETHGRALLERDDELRRITTSLAASCDGRGDALIVEGEPGIGKTSLLAAAAERAEELGLRVLSAHGGELERDFGWGVARQLVERELAGADPARRERLLAGAAGLAAPILDHDAAGGEPAQIYALEHGLYWLLSNLADERPLALLIDDLQWADAASLRFLVYLVRRLQGMPLVVIAAIRLGDPDSSDMLLPTLRAQPALRSITLGPLGERSVALLAAEALHLTEADAEFAHACMDASGGNPFMLLELLRTLTAEGATASRGWADRVYHLGSAAVSRSVVLRLSRLPADSVALARALAVLGSGAWSSEVASLAGLPDAAAALDALVEARIVAPERPLRFVHPLVRTAIYSDLPSARRASEHARAARMLAERRVPSTRVASQLLRAEPAGDDWVVEQLRAAAADAAGRGAPEAAVDYLMRALGEPPADELRPHVMRELGSARLAAGDTAGLEWLHGALDETEDPQTWAEIALELGSLLPIFQRTPEAVALLGEAARRCASDPERSRRLEATLAHVAEFDISTAAAAGSRPDADVAGLTGTDPDSRLMLATLAYRSAKRCESAAETAALATRAIAGGKLFEDHSTDILRSMYAVTALQLAERYDDAAKAIEQFFAASRSRGLMMGLSGAMSLRANLAHLTGALADAATDMQAAADSLSSFGPTPIANVGALVEVLIDMGEHEKAREVMASRIDDRREIETTSVFALFLLSGRGRLRIARGDVEGGLADLLELGRRCGQWGHSNPGQWAWRSTAALALLRLGDRERALELASEEVALARRWGTSRATAVALRAQALVVGGADGLELLAEAATVIADSPALLVRAQVLVDQGAALRRSGQRSAARDPLREGFSLATRCEAAPLAAHARDELNAIGARPRSEPRSGADALSPSERRVCLLAADGMSNPEIAQTLFVTRATVESHLHSSYRKLGIAGRRDLAAALGDEPPVAAGLLS